MTDHAPLFIGVPGDNEELTPEIAGAKAAELWRMSRLGLRVPPAFVLPIGLCGPVNQRDAVALTALDHGLREGIARLEEVSGRSLGAARNTLLVSVRSGAEKSMPGMLETILDVGITPESVRGLIALTGNPRLAWDSYRRFVQSYGEVVLDVPGAAFEGCLSEMMRAEGATVEEELDSEALERLTNDFRALVERKGCAPLPHDPVEQLATAARAVYSSWEDERAREYRRLNKLDHLSGTAVTVEVMVFGNSGPRSGAGVAFSRDPATGAKELYVDFLFDAQGEDIVAGRRSPRDGAALSARLPQVARELVEGARRLEREFRDIQDIEFTVQEGKLYFLQTRSAKRTPMAALRTLVDLVREGILDRATALERFAAIDVSRAALTRFGEKIPPIAKAIPASPGVASGRAVFDSARAKVFAAGGEPVILVRPDTSTSDVAGFAVAAGILTAAGGRTAHAAVVARQLGKPCLVGCRALTVWDQERRAELAGREIAEGTWLSLDGDSGEVIVGRQEIVSQRPQAELDEIESWRASEAVLANR